MDVSSRETESRTHKTTHLASRSRSMRSRSSIVRLLRVFSSWRAVVASSKARIFYTSAMQRHARNHCARNAFRRWQKARSSHFKNMIAAHAYQAASLITIKVKIKNDAFRLSTAFGRWMTYTQRVTEGAMLRIKATAVRCFDKWIGAVHFRKRLKETCRNLFYQRALKICR